MSCVGRRLFRSLGTTHLHTLEQAGAVLEAGRCGVECERCIWFDFGSGPSRLGVERRDGHMVTEQLSAAGSTDTVSPS